MALLIKTERLEDVSRIRIAHEAQAIGAWSPTGTSSPALTWDGTWASPTWSPDGWDKDLRLQWGRVTVMNINGGGRVP